MGRWPQIFYGVALPFSAPWIIGNGYRWEVYGSGDFGKRIIQFNAAKVSAQVRWNCRFGACEWETGNQVRLWFIAHTLVDFLWRSEQRKCSTTFNFACDNVFFVLLLHFDMIAKSTSIYDQSIIVQIMMENYNLRGIYQRERAFLNYRFCL